MRSNTGRDLLIIVTGLLLAIVMSMSRSNCCGTALALAATGADLLPSLVGVGEFAGQLDAMVPGFLDRPGIPGAAVGLIHNGEVAWTRSYGLADKENDVPVTLDTVFQVASISEPVAAWRVMRLVEQGRIDLLTSVEGGLTHCQLPPSGFNHAAATIRRLLSHTAGLSLHGYPGFEPDRPLPTFEEPPPGATAGAGDVRVVLPPGSEYMYSGGGYTLLQLTTEEVTGEPLADSMQREILAPLGRDNSSFEGNPDLQPVTATPYGVGGQPLPNYRHIARAASGLYTTVISLARFVVAGTTGPDGEPPVRVDLAPATLDKMFSPAAATDGRQGLGHRTERLASGTLMVLHGGASKGWKAHIAALPERGAGIVILTNSDLGDDLTADVLCLYSRWATGEVPLICQVVPKERNYALTVAGLLAVGLVACVGRVGEGIRSGRRQLDCTWRRGRFCSLALLDTALWWLLWYTDTASVLLEVWRDSATRLLMPATFDWVT